MERISTATKVADLFGAGKHGWRDGDIPGGIVPTYANAAWFNTVQEELANVVELGGTVLTPGNRTQLAQAIQAGKLFTGAAGGTADAITSAFSPAITALKDGMALYVRGALANATNAPTFTPNSGTIAPKVIVKGAGAALAPSDIAGAAHWIEVQYDQTLDKWVLLNPATGVSGSAPPGFRNRFFNGSMSVDQRNNGAAQTFTAAAALAYCVDRWYGYCTGANVSGQRVAGTAGSQHRYQFTGAASVTKIGFAQRIEKANCIDLAGGTATLSVDLANSLLATVNWTAWYANADDTFGSLASPTRTQIATGSFNVSAAVTRYSTAIAIPGAATTGIEVEFSIGAQTSGTWVIGNAQLEPGASATVFERRPIGFELSQCQRYGFMVPVNGAVQQGWAGAASAQIANVTVGLPVTMRVAPTVPTVSWSLVQANTPLLASSTPSRVDWSLSGTVASGSASASNASPFFLPAEL